MKSRIAPTPSGFLHIGNIVNFYIIWRLVRLHKGELILRIDDCDSSRTRPEFIEDIFFTLDWLGIDFDQGPSGPEDFQKNFSQSLRFNRCHEVLSLLENTFVCECTRSQLPKGGSYPGTCRHKRLTYVPGHNSIRLLADELPTGDFVIWRRDNLPAYQLVSVVEDVDMQITHIVRGEDLSASTEMQKHLAQMAGFSFFAKIKFIHHPLLLDKQGNKLSKSQKPYAVKSMRESGFNKQQIIDQVESFLEKAFSLDQVTL